MVVAPLYVFVMITDAARLKRVCLVKYELDLTVRPSLRKASYRIPLAHFTSQ